MNKFIFNTVLCLTVFLQFTVYGETVVDKQSIYDFAGKVKVVKVFVLQQAAVLKSGTSVKIFKKNDYLFEKWKIISISDQKITVELIGSVPSKILFLDIDNGNVSISSVSRINY